jgi:hypothetical protein
VFEWLPEGVEFVPDGSAADWLLATLEPWARDAVHLASFMPAGFEAYVRVFHPFQDPRRSLPPTRWRDVAARSGQVVGPNTMVRDIDDLTDEDRLPEEGSIPDDICTVLIENLTESTTTSDSCWFALWRGWGSFTQDEYNAPTFREPPGSRRESYLLFRGPAAAACSFEPQGWRHTPSFWWPNDRAWTVVTEIDGSSTYVGSDRSTVDAILAREDLETIEVDREVRIG